MSILRIKDAIFERSVVGSNNCVFRDDLLTTSLQDHILGNAPSRASFDAVLGMQLHDSPTYSPDANGGYLSLDTNDFDVSRFHDVGFTLSYEISKNFFDDANLKTQARYIFYIVGTSILRVYKKENNGTQLALTNGSVLEFDMDNLGRHDYVQVHVEVGSSRLTVYLDYAEFGSIEYTPDGNDISIVRVGGGGSTSFPSPEGGVYFRNLAVFDIPAVAQLAGDESIGITGDSNAEAFYPVTQHRYTARPVVQPSEPNTDGNNFNRDQTGGIAFIQEINRRGRQVAGGQLYAWGVGGIGWGTSAGGASWANNISDIATAMETKQYPIMDKLFVILGANDIGQVYALDDSFRTATMQPAIDRIIALGTSQIWVCVMSENTVDSGRDQARVDAMQAQTRLLTGVTIIEMDDLLTATGETFMRADGIHYNGFGQVFIGEHFAGLV